LHFYFEQNFWSKKLTLLAINIPTFERLESFSAVIEELELEINPFLKEFKNLIEINVFENDSSVAYEKQILCENIATRSGINIKFTKNNTNIGGDRNILQCCTANPDAIFTWVLGDDDHVIPSSLSRIFLYLYQYTDEIGLLILSTEGYDVDSLFKDKLMTYEQFARHAISLQPHLLIAHTLVSMNIFRTELFDKIEAAYVLNELTPRVALKANYVHMRGIVKGLLRNDKKSSVLIPNIISLDTNRRMASEVDLQMEIFPIYYFYFLWLLVELGIRVDQVPRHQNMWWLFENRTPTNWK
jgi:hypothetical protein